MSQYTHIPTNISLLFSHPSLHCNVPLPRPTHYRRRRHRPPRFLSLSPLSERAARQSPAGIGAVGPVLPSSGMACRGGAPLEWMCDTEWGAATAAPAAVPAAPGGGGMVGCRWCLSGRYVLCGCRSLMGTTRGATRLCPTDRSIQILPLPEMNNF